MLYKKSIGILTNSSTGNTQYLFEASSTNVVVRTNKSHSLLILQHQEFKLLTKKNIQYPNLVSVTKLVFRSDEISYLTFSSCWSTENLEGVETDIEESGMTLMNLNWKSHSYFHIARINWPCEGGQLSKVSPNCLFDVCSNGIR